MRTESGGTGAAVLEKYGMRRFAKFRIGADGSTHIDFLDDDLSARGKAIYAWLLDDEIVRIGSSKAPLRKRIEGHSRWIELRLKGKCQLKHEKRLNGQIEEARRWQEALIEGKTAEVWGRPGTEVKTQIGCINIYLSEENSLLEHHRPRFNNSHFR